VRWYRRYCSKWPLLVLARRVRTVSVPSFLGSEALQAVAVVGQHGETVAEGSSSDKQIDGMNPSGLTAVDQADLNLARHCASPVMQLDLDVGTGELAKVNRVLALGRATQISISVGGQIHTRPRSR
jgi:hypothetical protein